MTFGSLWESLTVLALALFTYAAIDEGRSGWIGRSQVDRSVEPRARWRLRTLVRVGVGLAGLLGVAVLSLAASVGVLAMVVLELLRPWPDLRTRFKMLVRRPRTDARPHAPAFGAAVGQTLAVVLAAVTLAALVVTLAG